MAMPRREADNKDGVTKSGVKVWGQSQSQGSGLTCCLRSLYLLASHVLFVSRFAGAVYHVTSRGVRREPIIVNAHARRARL